MSTEIQMFAIKHVPTGNYLPMGPRQNGRGGTLREPEPVEWRNLPRFFDSPLSASKALKCWLRGKYGVSHEDYGTEWNGVITPVPSRISEDMEIVPVTLEFP